jgi:hypothetical protein
MSITTDKRRRAHDTLDKILDARRGANDNSEEDRPHKYKESKDYPGQCQVCGRPKWADVHSFN